MTEERKLCDIIAKTASHNNLEGTDKDTVHSYADLYENELAPIRNTCRRVCELGVLTGASLAAWAEYFPNAIVDGVDVDLTRVKHHMVSDPRIRLHRMDATSSATATHLAGLCPEGYDLILDDASHHPEHQVTSFKILAPLLKSSGGVYIIEDIDGEHADALRARLSEAADQHRMHMSWHDLRHVKNRYDDIVAIFRPRLEA